MSNNTYSRPHSVRRDSEREIGVHKNQENCKRTNPRVTSLHKEGLLEVEETWYHLELGTCISDSELVSDRRYRQLQQTIFCYGRPNLSKCMTWYIVPSILMCSIRQDCERAKVLCAEKEIKRNIFIIRDRI